MKDQEEVHETKIDTDDPTAPTKPHSQQDFMTAVWSHKTALSEGPKTAKVQEHITQRR